MRWTDALSAREQGTVSPLWLVSDEPQVNDLVVYLDQMRRAIEESPNAEHTISFSRASLHQVRGAFAQYLSPALVEQLAAEPDRLQLGGEM